MGINWFQSTTGGGGDSSTDSGNSDAESLSGGRFVTSSGTGIRWGALGLTLFSAVLAAVAGSWIAIVESLVSFQIWIIDGFGSFFQGLIIEILGPEGASGLVTASWRAALVEAVKAGPLAPFLLAAEAIFILIIAYAIWERRPYFS